ncbi:MAG: hypothetical protein R3F59_17725 [Myxococcota bacterium]
MSALLLALVGCTTTIRWPPDLWRTESADTGAGGPSTTWTATTLPTPPPAGRIVRLDWGCDVDRTAFTWDLTVDGWTAASELDLLGDNGGHEAHDLVATASDPAGAWEDLRVGPLLAGVPAEEQVPGESTRFRCDEPERMSFALRIRDAAGVLRDCVVGGADPTAVTALIRSLDPELNELGACRLARDVPSTPTTPTTP